MRDRDAWQRSWLMGMALAASLVYAGCTVSHDVAPDSGVSDPRDAGSSDTRDGGRPDSAVITQDAAVRDQAPVPTDIAVDPPWGPDLAAWLDAGGCGEMTFPYQSFSGPDEIVLFPGAALPWTSGIVVCGVTVDLVARAVVESNPGGDCSPNVDMGTTACNLWWSSPLSVDDYLWLCRVEGLSSSEGIRCFEWGE